MLTTLYVAGHVVPIFNMTVLVFINNVLFVIINGTGAFCNPAINQFILNAVLERNNVSAPLILLDVTTKHIDPD